MDNLLRKIQVDDEVVLYKEEAYSPIDRQRYLDQFGRYKKEGKIRGEFTDDMWIGSSGIKTFQIDFSFNEVAYASHMKKELGFSVKEIRDMIRCYAVYICGEYIYRTIAQKVSLIKRMLTEYEDEGFTICKHERATVMHFLAFAGMPEPDIDRIMRGISTIKDKQSRDRELSDFINYLAVDSELTDMYTSELPDAEFVRWFPVFFWTKVTFLIPLRATEMCVTPFDCIRRDGKDVYIRLRRSMLKKGNRSVFYDVDRDYRIFEYRIPDNHTVAVIEKYVGLTRDHERRFLFDYTSLSTNGIYSLQSFNILLEAFVRERLVGNRKYDYAKYACGIKEFSVIVAGDSRPIAMSNIYYQNAGAEICRQLADHMHLTTSEGYYTNVAKTVMASSIMRMQQKINSRNMDIDKEKAYLLSRTSTDTAGVCLSPKKPMETGDIRDCVQQNHIDDDCVGCIFHNPGNDELDKEIEKRKKAFLVAGKAMLDCITRGSKDPNFDKVFLNAHTGITRFGASCDEKAAKEFTKWQRYNDIMKN